MNVYVQGLGITVKGDRKLLNDVSCTVQSGDMVALMGPSGAGKTTLLNSIVGRPTTGQVDGGIQYNGKPIDKVRSSVGYVTQDDIMYETLTVRENLSFAAAFILPAQSKAERAKAVEEVIQKLSLKKCSETVVGSPGLVRGISGGERKRTNVALSLLGKPSLLLLDEPTSGLDSKMSDSLMRDVKMIAEQGCTVVATIHQPSEAVFLRFDKVLLLETGRVAYYGPVKELRSSLQGLGFPCPEGTPLPELLLDVLEQPKENEDADAAAKALAGLRKMSDTSAPELTEISPAHLQMTPRRAGFCGQLATLLHRELVNVKRNKMLTVVRSMQTIAASFLIGLIFLQLDNNLAGIQTRFFSSFLLVFSQVMFSLLGVINTFPAERAVFLRETQDKLYHPAAFYFSKVAVDTVMQCAFPLLVLAIAYPLIGLNAESAERVLLFYVVLAVCSNCGSAMGFTVSAATSSVNVGLSIAPGLVMPQMLLSGVFMKTEDLPQPFGWLSYLMLARYAVQATVANEFACTEKPSCDASWRLQPESQCDNSPCDFCCTTHEIAASGGICPVLTCEDAVRSLNMDTVWPSGETSEETILYNILALLVLLVLFRLQGLNALMMSYRRATTGRCLPFRCPNRRRQVEVAV
ncbi:unnamed protein product [Effrenium voratum]|nr:unnamed protein product [Effrenium voratum]